MKKYGCALLLCLILLPCIAIILWMNSSHYYVQSADRSRAGSVARSFVLALAENKEIKPLVAPELWPVIDRWMVVHEVFKCSPTSFFSVIDSDTSGGGGFIGTDRASYYYLYELYCPEIDRSYYSFAITEIMLERIDGEWEVIGWGEICEIRPDENECDNPLD